MSRASKGTTVPGFQNPNGQIVVRKTNLRGNLYPNWTYVLRCEYCSKEYGANGCDIHVRLCPYCQRGAPGLPINADEPSATRPAAGREKARELAQEYLRKTYPHGISAVLDAADVNLRGILLDQPHSLENCWVAFIQQDPWVLRSSSVVIVDKQSGEIRYHGSLHDEG